MIIVGTAAFFAAQDGHLSCLQALNMAGADLCIPDELLCTPLMMAAVGNKVDIVEEMVSFHLSTR